MKFTYNESWAFFIAPERSGKTYQTKRIIKGVLSSGKVRPKQIVILDVNNAFTEFDQCERIVPSINEYNYEFLDVVLQIIRGSRDILFVGDDIDVFLRTGYESRQLDLLGKTIKQQSIGGILQTHRAKFFNARIFQICDFVFVGYGLSQTDVKHLRDNINLDVELYKDLKPQQFVLIDRTRNKQKIIKNVGK